MASILSLLKSTAILASSGLAGLEADAAPSSPSAEPAVVNLAGFIGYDDLVKAKAILDLLVKLPSFDEELGVIAGNLHYSTGATYGGANAVLVELSLKDSVHVARNLGRYSASLELCGSILARSIRVKRQSLGKRAMRPTDSKDSKDESLASRPREKSIGVGRGCEGALAAGVVPASGQSTLGFSTAPTTWEPDDSLTFDSIVGNSTAKRALFEHVVLPLKLSEEARNSLFAGIRSSGNNVLLHGPPGTGKTTIAQAASQEAGAAFYSVTPSSILSKYQGESERVLHQLFDDAKQSKPSIIFLDELDALAPSRDAQDDVQSRRLLAELLLQTSQLRPKDQVVVIAATNRMDDIDIALLRRFHSRIFVGPPSHKERVEMIATFMEGIQHCLDDKQVTSLANRIPGWSGSDIKSLCKEACMGPVRSLYEQQGGLERAVMQQPSGGGPVMLRPVDMSDCDTAYATLMGKSAPLNTEQGSESMCDDLVGNQLIGDLDRAEEERGEGHGDDGGEGRDQSRTEKQPPPDDFVDELVPDLGGVERGDLHSIQQRVL